MIKNWLISSALLMLIILCSCAAISNKTPQKGSDKIRTKVCGSDIDPSQAISQSLSSEDWAENEQTAKTLLLYANKSTDCRTAIINQLIEAMDKPNPNFLADQRTYHLWSTGAALLGELKAVEALDLLINHLDLNDGHFSASGVHQPAVFGIRKMGSLAVPKLEEALSHNANRNIRLAAAWCLSDIGGKDAKHSLKHALESESDPCVRRLITLLLEPANKSVIEQRILALQCDN